MKMIYLCKGKPIPIITEKYFLLMVQRKLIIEDGLRASEKINIEVVGVHFAMMVARALGYLRMIRSGRFTGQAVDRKGHFEFVVALEVEAGEPPAGYLDFGQMEVAVFAFDVELDDADLPAFDNKGDCLFHKLFFEVICIVNIQQIV